MDLLRDLICEDKSIVTYKWLSRQLRIPANDAKQLLYQFMTESMEQVHCVYCVSGFLSTDEMHHIILVPQEDLEITKKKFSKLTGVHVYSVQASRPKSGAVLLATQKPVDDPKNPSEFASIVNVNIHIIERQIPVHKPQLAETVHKKVHLGSQNTPGGNAKLVPDPPKATGKKPPAKTVNSFFGSAQSKKKPELKKEQITKMEIEEEEPVIERRKRTRKVKSIVQSDDEEVIDVTKPVEDDVDVVNDKPISDDTEMDIEVDNEKSRSEGEGEGKSEDKDESESENKASDTPVQTETQEIPNTNAKRKRGRRRIQKKRTYKNDRGYMVTEDTYEWESCTDDEPETNQTKPANPLPAKAKTKKETGSSKKGKPAQKNLMSFWGKK